MKWSEGTISSKTAICDGPGGNGRDEDGNAVAHESIKYKRFSWKGNWQLNAVVKIPGMTALGAGTQGSQIFSLLLYNAVWEGASSSGAAASSDLLGSDERPSGRRFRQDSL